MQTTWIMQTNMGAHSDIGAYVQGVRDSGAQVVEVAHIPFSNTLPQVDVDGPVVVYGSVGFVTAVHKAGQWPTGVFSTPETFTYAAWAEHYGALLLNSPDSTQLTTIGGFAGRQPVDNTDIFVRPQHDTKSLVGQVWRGDAFHAFCRNVCQGGYPELDVDTEIVVGVPYGIEAEWRLFVVDHQVVGASQYRRKGQMHKQAGAPDDVLAFAQHAIETWSPVCAYTLDVCRSAGQCYIVEAQGFNSAGHYACDVAAVASAVNKVAAAQWLQQTRPPTKKL